MLYNVLLAEDEILVRLGIKNSVNWAEMNMRVVADVSDGVEAYEQFVSLSPDVVVTDIKMGRMDGSELIRKIREIDSHCAIIIISCMDDFNLLREMICYNITGYLLKASMSMTDIEDLLKKAESLLNQSRLAETASTVHILRAEEFLGKFILTGKQEYLSSYKVAASRQITPRSLVLVNLITHDGGDINPLGFSSIQDILYQKFTGSIVVSLSNDGFLFLLEEEIYVEDKRFSEVSQMTLEYMDINISVLIKMINCELHELPQKFQELYDLYRFTNEPMTPQVLEVSQIDRNEYIRLNLAPLEAEIISFKSQKEHDFSKRFEVVCEAAMEGFPTFLTSLLTTIKYMMGSACDEKLDSDLTGHIYNCKTLYEALKIYAHTFQVVEGAKKEERHISDPSILEVVEYMQAHYVEDLSLSGMAEMAGFSTNYFSTRFKQEVGLSFVNFLNEIRIDAAKQLLENTSNYFYEISELVGYHSFEYFSRIFKQRTGFNLGEWRRLNHPTLVEI